jgi:2-polyprenyl-6-methoxyphenol hydroxylase-like FAD-dependent oxidoreductase
VSQRPLHAVIIGAGMSGACLAHRLKWAGVGVSVYERESARGDGFFGLRVTIGPDGSRALQEALPPDLYQTFVTACAEPPRHLTVYSETLDELFSSSLPPPGRQDGDAAAYARPASPMTLRQVLLTGIEDVVRFGKEFTHYKRRPDGRVTAFFGDGTSAVGDVLVGADGAHSQVRDQYLPQAGLLDCGFVAAYGQISLSDAAAMLPRKRMLGGMSIVRGRHGMSFITAPFELKWDRRGEPKSHVGVLDAALIKSWPGLLFDSTSDHLMWGLMVSSRRLQAEPDTLRGAELVATISQLIRRWHPALSALISLTDPATAAATRAIVSRPVPRWEPTEVTLLGDAHHCRIPDRGAGANAALYAAGLLAGQLIEAAAQQRPVVEAIRVYEARVCGPGAAGLASRRCLNRKALMDKPVIGSVLAAGTRARLRVAGQVPPLKKRVTREFSWLQDGDAA